MMSCRPQQVLSIPELTVLAVGRSQLQFFVQRNAKIWILVHSWFGPAARSASAFMPNLPGVPGADSRVMPACLPAYLPAHVSLCTCVHANVRMQVCLPGRMRVLECWRVQ